jgi:hypothetical protein
METVPARAGFSEIFWRARQRGGRPAEHGTRIIRQCQTGPRGAFAASRNARKRLVTQGFPAFRRVKRDRFRRSRCYNHPFPQQQHPQGGSYQWATG